MILGVILFAFPVLELVSWLRLFKEYQVFFPRNLCHVRIDLLVYSTFGLGLWLGLMSLGIVGRFRRAIHKLLLVCPLLSVLKN